MPEYVRSENQWFMEELRQQLDAIDTEILRLMEQRMDICRQIGAIKKQKCLPIYQPEQYRKHLNMLKGATSLNGEFVQQLYDVIHSEALKTQLI